MHKPLAAPMIGAAVMRRTGVAIRTAQSIGIEWMDLGKQSYDDVVATTGKIAACRNPRELAALQSDFVQRAVARVLARSVVLSDQCVASLGHLANLAPATAGPRRSA